MGELLKEYDGSTRAIGKEGAHLTSQADAADAAGISEHQRKQAVSTVGPMTFALKLIKEICQRPSSRDSRRFIGGKAAAFDPDAHRFPTPDYPPAPRRRIGRHASCKNVIAQMVQFLDHSLRIIADDAYRWHGIC
jgi:hypothetical protein